MSLMALRERMPFPLFIIVLVIALMLAGLACACFTDHPEQLPDRAFLAVTEAPFPFAVAAFVAIAALLTAPLLLPQTPARARLQSFRL